MFAEKINFPDPRYFETVEDIIYVGGSLNVENLIQAYSMGIFPWPHEGYPLLWFSPDERGILDFKDLHLSRSFKKWIRQNEGKIKVTVNQCFEQVIRACQKQKRSGQKGSWITEEMVIQYVELNKMGKALSLECWLDNELISGIYGVQSKKYFSCESMFFKKENASKYAFVKLVEYLSDRGQTWMDLQMVTEVSESFGARYVDKDFFLDLIY